VSVQDTAIPAAAAPAPSTELARDLGLFEVTMVGVGAMVGAGIFALTGIAAGAAGPGLILAFALNGILTLCTAMVYAEIGSAIPAAGGGYLWTKFGLPGPSAFLAGWMDWLAHAVAGSLYAVIFGSYIVWGLQTVLGWGEAPTGAEHGEMGTLFGLNAVYFAKALTLGVCLLFIYVNYKGSSETGKTGSVITVAKIAAIGIFVVFGLVAMWRGGTTGEDLATVPVAEKFTPLLPQGMSGVLVAMGLTFIAFEGYEIIVQAGEEVVNPRRNIPKAVFWSLAIVIPIYVLVAIVCLGALSIPAAIVGSAGAMTAGDTWDYLARLGETGVAEAANQFMPWGTGAILLVAAALLSTMSALNATTYSSTRVSFAMARDRNLPAFMASVSPKTRTPVWALVVSGVLITGAALALDAERVAAATCVMFLLVFTAVNVSAITIRRKYGDKLRYGYVMPLYPLFPIVAIVGQLAVAAFLFHHEPLSMFMTAGWVAFGLVVYYTYSRHQEHEFKATKVVFEQKPVAEAATHDVLVPVANVAEAGPLVDLASRLARPAAGGLVVLHVVPVPEQLPYDAAERFISEARRVVDEALAAAASRDIAAVGLMRVAHKPARSIVDTIVERKCRTLVMGWSGPRRSRRIVSGPHWPLLGTEIDSVLSRADADTVVLRGELPESPQRILVPIVNPRQGRFSVAVAEAVAGAAAAIQVLTVVRTKTEADGAGQRVMEAMFGTPDLQAVTAHRGLPVTMDVVVDASALRAIFAASEAADLLIIGAAAETWSKRRSFTPFHFDLARLYTGPLLLAKLHTGAAKFATQRAVEFFVSKEPEA
jgi:amino acid transporter